MAPDRTVGLLHALPFVGSPMHHLLNLNSVARPGARGVRCLEERLKHSLILATSPAVGIRGLGAIGGNSGQS